MPNTLYIPATQMQDIFCKTLIRYGFNPERADLCAEVFTQNSLDGVYTHGVNRFPRFVSYTKEGYINPAAEPTLVHRFGALEQWDGQLGPGPLNALQATDRVLSLAKQHGVACLALGRTNHWMRGGTYAWRAAKAGFIFMAWTNTIGNMPAWGAQDTRLGNNPFVIGLPFREEAIVLDMAMSQFSFGAMELAAMKQEKLSVPGGYDKQGALSQDPQAILESGRSIPIGFWKGAGLSLLLDILASVLSGGSATHEISKTQVEYGVSQVFIAIDPQHLADPNTLSTTLEAIISDYQASDPLQTGQTISYPGERVLLARQRNSAQGIPVLETVWKDILNLA